MEAAIICEGFKRSEEMYKIRYAKLIADGDSSVYKILESRPFKHLTVEKVECKNHLLWNMCTRLKKMCIRDRNNTLGQLGEGQSALGLLQQECMKSAEHLVEEEL